MLTSEEARRDLAQHMAGLSPEDRKREYQKLELITADFMSESQTDAELTHIEAQNGATLTAFTEIPSLLTHWLWTGRIPLGMLSELLADEGTGKSTVSMRWIADLTNGTLPGDFNGQPAKVAILSTEEDPNRTMRPRLDAAGADLSMVFNLKMRKDGEDRGLAFPQDAPEVAKALGKAGVKLVIIDPLAGCLDPKVNTWKDTEVRAALTPLIQAAQEHQFAVMGIRHTNKRTGASPREKAMGSVGFEQIVRSAMLLAKDPKDEDKLVLAHFKCNVGKMMPSLSVTLESKTVKVEGKDQSYASASIGGEVDWTADDLSRGNTADSAQDDAARWLYVLLASGPVASAEVRKQADLSNHAWRTVERARKDSDDIIVEQVKTGWQWRLDTAASVEF